MKYATRLTARTGDSRISGAAPDRYKWSDRRGLQGLFEQKFLSPALQRLLRTPRGGSL